MKRIVFLFLLLTVAGFSYGQDSLPVYKRFPTVPPFKMISVKDSTVFQKADLKNKKATMVMIFSPDCDHCQHATKELLANAAKFKKMQIVMASAASYEMIQQFYKDYGIAAHPNISMGTDQGYFLSSFYNIKSFPSVFLYDKKGNLTQYFEGAVNFTTLDPDPK